MRAHDYISKMIDVSDLRRTLKSCCAFTLVEIALAIAVLAIGLLGTLVLIPVGLDATRTASDNTETATIAAEFISKFQQAALSTNNYAFPGPGLDLNVFAKADYFQTITNDNGVIFYSHIMVTNTDFAQINSCCNPLTGGNWPTNTISRVVIDLWRPGGNTNTYVTEVVRYALP